jgi:hypothetical protein
MTGAVAPDDQLEYEARNAQRAGIAAIAAGVLLLVSSFYPALFATKGTSARSYDSLLRIHAHLTDVLVPQILEALAYPLIAVALLYLYRAAKARRPETPKITRVLAIGGPTLVAIGSLMYGIAVVVLAQKAADAKLPTYATDPSGGIANLVGVWNAGELRASDLTTGSSLYTATAILELVSNLAFGFAMVLIGLNAMRAGLVSRFMGILGIIAGVITVLFRGISPIEAFWLIAVGMLFMNRWPNGRGPAWDSLEPLPWPTAADRQREVMEKRGVTPPPRRRGRAEPEPIEGDAEEIDDAPEAMAHPVSKKRKRKRRR